MRICSLLPSATEIIAQLGLIDSLVGVSEECRWPPEVIGKPVVTAAKIDPSALDEPRDRPCRARLDWRRRVALHRRRRSDRRARPRSDRDPGPVYRLRRVEQPAGDGLSGGCRRALARSANARRRRRVGPQTRRRTRRGRPRRSTRFADVGSDRGGCRLGAGAATPARLLRRVDRAAVLRRALAARDDRARRRYGTSSAPRANPRTFATTWDTVVAHEPKLIVIAPCGFDADTAAERAAELRLPCPAVAVDGDSYYSRPAPRLADGVRQLAHLFHPEAAADPGLPAIVLDGGGGAPRSQRAPSRRSLVSRPAEARLSCRAAGRGRRPCRPRRSLGLLRPPCSARCPAGSRPSSSCRTFARR